MRRIALCPANFSFFDIGGSGIQGTASQQLGRVPGMFACGWGRKGRRGCLAPAQPMMIDAAGDINTGLLMYSQTLDDGINERCHEWQRVADSAVDVAMGPTRESCQREGVTGRGILKVRLIPLPYVGSVVMALGVRDLHQGASAW